MNYIRTDTRKVDEEDASILIAIMEAHNLPRKQGKNEAYRIALHTWANLYKIPESVTNIDSTIDGLTEQVNQLNFILNTGISGSVAHMTSRKSANNKKYIRTDTIKVYEEGSKILDRIMETRRISKRQGKSGAYRIALRTWLRLHNAPEALTIQNARLEALTEQVKQLYFKVQGGMK